MSRRIVIVGGGIAGLAAAHRLLELRNAQALDLEILLLEASHRLGGCIATERVGDFLIEAGPDSFISEKPWALLLCERLGLGPRLVSTQAAYQKIYIVHKGKLVPLPEGFFLLAPTQLAPFVRTPLFSWRGKLRMLAEPLMPRGDANVDESLGAFVRRRFGSEVLERVAQPLLGGIYAADPDKLSLIATMPRFKEMEKSRRSIIWAMWSEQRRRARKREGGSGARWSLFVTLAGGMQEFVDAIAQRLPQGSARLDTAVTNIFPGDGQQKCRIAIGTSEILEADGIILATPAFHTAQILASAAPEAAKELSSIAYASSATISLAYRNRDFPRMPDSFGFVVPAIESRKIIACTFSSLKYPGRAPEGHVLLRAFVGGSLQTGSFGRQRSDPGTKRPSRDRQPARRQRRTAVGPSTAPSQLYAAISHRPSGEDSTDRISARQPCKSRARRQRVPRRRDCRLRPQRRTGRGKVIPTDSYHRPIKLVTPAMR